MHALAVFSLVVCHLEEDEGRMGEIEERPLSPLVRFPLRGRARALTHLGELVAAERLQLTPAFHAASFAVAPCVPRASRVESCGVLLQRDQRRSPRISPAMRPATSERPPPRSPEQRIKALEKANEIRRARAELKRDLKAGTVQMQTILRDPPDYAQTAKVFDLLLAVPKFGRVKATRLLRASRTSEAKTLGGLSERQRADLQSALRD